jgi:predicted RNA-binding Zn ribbon-like protein
MSSLVMAFLDASLSDADKLGSWIARNGVLTVAPFVADAQLEDAGLLRSALSRALRAEASGEPIPPRDLATINSFADEDPPRLALLAHGTLARTAAAPLPATLAVIARAAIELLASRGSDFRICEAAGCGRLFLDDSRGRRRRWCSMTRCGNRAKAMAFRERQNDIAKRTLRR